MTTFLLYILLLNPAYATPESNLSRLFDCWLMTEPEPCVYAWDRNNDGIVNFVDYAEMVSE